MLLKIIRYQNGGIFAEPPDSDVNLRHPAAGPEARQPVVRPALRLDFDSMDGAMGSRRRRAAFVRRG
jgi:hypothetical protein